jgi:hypothetical protein
MNGKHKKLAMSLLFQVFWNDKACVIKNTVFPGCFSLSALTYSSLTDVQKFLTPRPFIVSESVNTR